MFSALLVAALLSTASSSSGAEASIRVPVEVSIGLLGFDGDGAWQVELDASELHSLLTRLLPERRPACGPAGEGADALYSLKYNVVQMRTGLPPLQKTLAAAFREALSAHPSEPAYTVNIGDVSSHFDMIFNSYFAAQGSTAAYTVLVINPNRADMAGLANELPSRAGSRRVPAAFTYRYVESEGAPPTQAWVSGGRYAVLDLSAGPSRTTLDVSSR